MITNRKKAQKHEIMSHIIMAKRERVGMMIKHNDVAQRINENNKIG